MKEVITYLRHLLAFITCGSSQPKHGRHKDMIDVTLHLPGNHKDNEKIKDLVRAETRLLSQSIAASPQVALKVPGNSSPKTLPHCSPIQAVQRDTLAI
ncbi:hypothetical protein SRHO_G00029740 [Serrasalmus rhombeus]